MVDVNGTDIDLTPPETMQNEAQRGLDWREEHGRGGTDVGVRRGRQLVNGGELSVDDVVEMAAWKARHMVDRDAEGWSPGDDGYPSAGRIAAALWGLPAGDGWVDERRDMIERAKEKSMTETKRKAVDTTVKAMDEDGARRVKVIASTATEDRVGDVVRAEGISLDRYKQNPVVLWGHDQDHPVAKCTDIGVRDGKLVAGVEFPPEGTTAKSDEVYRMIKAGIINAVSIGFKPMEADRHGDKGYDFTKSELLEFSFVSVPANPDALIVERSLRGAEQVTLMRKNLRSVEKQTKFLTFDEALNGSDWYEGYYERHWALLESWQSISEDDTLSDTGRKQAMRASFDDFVDSVLAMMGDTGGDSTNPNEPDYTPDPSEISMMSTTSDITKRSMRLKMLKLRSAHTNALNGV